MPRASRRDLIVASFGGGSVPWMGNAGRALIGLSLIASLFAIEVPERGAERPTPCAAVRRPECLGRHASQVPHREVAHARGGPCIGPGSLSSRRRDGETAGPSAARSSGRTHCRKLALPRGGLAIPARPRPGHLQRGLLPSSRLRTARLGQARRVSATGLAPLGAERPLSSRPHLGVGLWAYGRESVVRAKRRLRCWRALGSRCARRPRERGCGRPRRRARGGRAARACAQADSARRRWRSG